MKLGRYEVVRELGKGAMGIVYLAKDPLIGRLVALKTIRLGAHADDEETKEFQQRFIREAQAAGILNHPAIVTVHDIGQDESGMSFIAMEYVEGQNLKEVLSQGRALTFEQIGDIIAQVAEGLDFAHSKGIVHRDVKPANIILLEGNRAKITDFGIAKVVSGVANLTTTGQFLGTPNYMAPEQIKGAPVDGRTDIFSLGICLYECLTRRKPFGGDSLTTISYRIVHEPFPSLLEINPQIPEGFEEIVTQCLQKDPARRYQRGKELANAIRAVIRGERPVRPEPMLADETVVTRDRDKLPTMEIPFPEAAQPAPEPPVAVAATGLRTKVAATTQPVPPPPVAQPARVAKPAGASILRYPIPAVLFFAVIALAIAALAIVVALLRSKQVTVPAVDVAAESKHAHERKLRVEGNDLLHRGHVDDAYAKFEELRRLAPNSPAITLLLSRLSSARQQQEANAQQQALIKQKLDQGIALYNDKKYADSIPLLDEAFHLNPSSDDAANYLKLAQQALEKQQEAKAVRQNTPKVATSTTGTHGTTTTNGGRPVQTNGTPAVPATPAQLTTIINANVSDGYILVKVGEQVAAHENLWEESGRFIRRKKPRVVNVTKELTPANTDVEIWVVIPSMSIQEHRTLKQNFQPGAAHKLLVTFDPQSKRFDYQMN